MTFSESSSDARGHQRESLCRWVSVHAGRAPLERSRSSELEGLARVWSSRALKADYGPWYYSTPPLEAILP